MAGHIFPTASIEKAGAFSLPVPIGHVFLIPLPAYGLFNDNSFRCGLSSWLLANFTRANWLFSYPPLQVDISRNIIVGANIYPAGAWVWIFRVQGQWVFMLFLVEYIITADTFSWE